jgi:ABC-2 type transport system ATP-binding protein
MVLSQRIEATRVHFTHKDFDLAYSNMLDAVLESEDLKLFRRVIALEESKEQQTSFNEQAWLDQCLEICDELEQIEIPEKKIQNSLLSCKDLEKTYSRGNFTLGPISMELKPGQLIGLVGENGNGKTTLLRILAKEIAFSRGELHYSNETEFDNNYDHRTKLTYIPQRTQKWYGKIRTNLRFCATHYGITGLRNELLVEMMLIRFGLFKFRALSWSELSSGYKMRFELARTFLRRPEILLLDEPLANLDVVTQQIVLNDLKSLAKSAHNPIGIILSSQQLFEVERVADEVIFLKNGAPKLLERENKSQYSTCVIELETPASRQQIESALDNLPDIRIHFNGGMYVISSEKLNRANQVLDALVSHDVHVSYYRDISESSKRFFVH